MQDIVRAFLHYLCLLGMPTWHEGDKHFHLAKKISLIIKKTDIFCLFILNNKKLARILRLVSVLQKGKIALGIFPQERKKLKKRQILS